MVSFEEKTIGRMVADDYRTAAVFKAFNIDFCCKGNRTLAEVCEKAGISEASLRRALAEVDGRTVSGQMDFTSWPLDLLADFIEKTHHRYVRRTLPEIEAYLEKVCRVHGKQHPELLVVRKLFMESVEDLSAHMHKEEYILFPFIRRLAAAADNGEQVSPPPFQTVSNPITMMMHEHETEGARFAEIANLTDQYTPPADACNTYRVTFALLKEFEEDLHLHIHLENNILFPAAVELEKTVCRA